MANYEATRYDFDGQYLTDIEGVNTGIIVPWSTASVPSGFLECDGTAVSRSTYSALFSVVGTNYGIGDGSTTFNVPNLNDSIPVHKSPTKAQFSTGGSETETAAGNITGLSIDPTTIDDSTMAAHSHPTNSNAPMAQNLTQPAYQNPGPVKTPGTWGTSGSNSSHSHSGSASFTGGASSVLQPYLTTKYIIKT
tara:strand:+ start:442 stop:1020 length:579 start_codon:yes stop_codon:yes gene_type:complete